MFPPEPLQNISVIETVSGEPFAQRLVRELGLPAGCVLVRSDIDGRERVVTADTRLEPQMRITAVIAPEANNALEILRSGCAAKH